jgi:hypothetical protein
MLTIVITPRTTNKTYLDKNYIWVDKVMDLHKFKDLNKMHLSAPPPPPMHIQRHISI